MLVTDVRIDPGAAREIISDLGGLTGAVLASVIVFGVIGLGVAAVIDPLPAEIGVIGGMVFGLVFAVGTAGVQPPSCTAPLTHYAPSDCTFGPLAPTPIHFPTATAP